MCVWYFAALLAIIEVIFRFLECHKKFLGTLPSGVLLIKRFKEEKC